MQTKFKGGATATGTAAYYLPPCDETEEILFLIRMGARFRAQQVGKRPGILSRTVLACAARADQPSTFSGLLIELEREAARRALHGIDASPIEKVDRVWQLLTWHHPKEGRKQTPFSTIQNHLTEAKKVLASRIPAAAKP